MKTDLVNRFQTLLDVLNITPNELSNKAGYKTNGQIYRMLAGKYPISMQMVIGVNQHHPEVNLDWLITGRGQMFLSKYMDQPKNQLNEPAPIYQTNVVKLVTIKHQGLYIENFDHAEFIQGLPSINSKKTMGTHRDFECTSSIPETNIVPGDIIRCKKLDLPALFRVATSPDFNAVVISVGNILIGKSRVKNDAVIITNHKTITTIPREDINEVWEITDVIKSIN